MFDRFKRWISGAKTYEIMEYAHPCEGCLSEGITTTGIKLLVDVNAEGKRERLTVHCPRCGPIKSLYAERPQPRYQAAFTEAVTGRDIKRLKEV